jgi:hypothetical protein
MPHLPTPHRHWQQQFSVDKHGDKTLHLTESNSALDSIQMGK